MAKPDDTGRGRRSATRRVEATIDTERGVFMISVAAELADMHPQTLRMYEARGLITPKRSPKKTRLYSQSDVERLRRIQRMTSDEGLNLAGVEAVMKMEDQLQRMRAELERMRRRAKDLEREMNEEVERVRRSLKAELVPYGRYDTADLVPADQARSIKIPVQRARRPS
jgi:MerR family transcriptional regulator/heat shock protein HspR